MNDLTVPAPEVSSVQCAPVPPISPGAGPVSGIYAIRCLVNGKVYVGKSCGLIKRRQSHFRLLSSGKHPNKHLQSSFHKYGRDSFSFEVLELTPVELLSACEISWIQKLNSRDQQFGYNLDFGGAGGPRSEETKRKISAARKGIKLSPEAREKISRTLTGRRMPSDIRKKISGTMKGDPDMPARMAKARGCVDDGVRVSRLREALFVRGPLTHH